MYNKVSIDPVRFQEMITLKNTREYDLKIHRHCYIFFKFS